MSDLHHLKTGNRLLQAFSPADFELVRGGLERLHVDHRFSLSKAGQALEYVYFPESGLASVTGALNGGKVEVGLIGSEGFAGLPVVLGTSSSPTDVFVQMPGVFLRLPARRLREAMAQSSAVRDLLLRYVQVVLVQSAHTAMANASCTLEERLARWLLMCHDRNEGNELVLTHEFLAMMLGVRRPGVTVATHVLEGEKMIRANRGRITVLDRTKLEKLAGGSYGGPEAEYERLIPAAPMSRAPERVLERVAAA